MTHDDTTGISSAFELLLAEIQAAIDHIKHTGARAFEQGDYEGVDKARKEAEKLTVLFDEVAALHREWLEPSFPTQRHRGRKRRQRKATDRLPPGVRTPADAYRVPILRVLEEMGGSARTPAVREGVFAIMKAHLRDVDLQPVPTDRNRPRWWNSAQWERHRMVQEGLLREGSPRGVWEDAGREYLRRRGH